MKKTTIAVILFCFLSIAFGHEYYQNKLSEISVSASESQKEANKQDRLNREINLNQLLKKNSISNVVDADVMNTSNDISNKIINGEDVCIVFLGDSTTEQNKYTNGKDGHVNLIRNRLNTISNVEVINAGVSGDDSSLMFKRLKNDVILYQPDLVIVNTGINDAVNLSTNEIKKNIDSIVKELKEDTNAKIIFRTSTSTKDQHINNRIVNEINPIAKGIAEKYNIGYVDLYSYFNSATKDQKDYYMKDSWHPNEKGQRIISDFLIKVILTER